MLAKPLSSLVNQAIIGHDREVRGIALDSRLVGQDYLFLAVRGEASDGHDYIRQAITNGAGSVAVENEAYIQPATETSYVSIPALKAEAGHIAARFYNHPSTAVPVIGVTGTNGKTSITHYIAQLLALSGKHCAVIGTLGIYYNGRKLPTRNTTPDAITLQKSLYDMVNDGVSHVAMEVSSHALHQQRCAGIGFDTAIMSNITHDHLDYHGDFNAYKQAKLALFAMAGLRLAIVNADDESIAEIKSVAAPATRIISYALRDHDADVYLSGIEINARGYKAVLHYFGERHAINIPLLGEFNLYNVLAALIAVCEQGFPVDDVITGIARLVPVAGRMQLVDNPHNIVAVVDYAHTPDALQNVLQNLRGQVAGNIIVVFGCGGDRDREKRPKMAAIAEAHADSVVITADNPRTEKLEAIIADMQAGITSDKSVVIPAREEAIVWAVAKAAAGDCILVAGKGHEKIQIIGYEEIPFDDVEVLGKALKHKDVALC